MASVKKMISRMLDSATTPEVMSLEAQPADAPATVDMALRLACASGNARRIEECLKRGVSLDMEDRDGDRPLQLAAIGGHLEAVQLLLGAKAAPDDTKAGRQTALQIAVERDNGRMVNALLEAGASPNGSVQKTSASSSGTLVELAIAKPVCLDLLLKAKASPDDDGASQPPIVIAGIMGYARTVELLLAAGAKRENLGAKGETRAVAAIATWLLKLETKPAYEDTHTVQSRLRCLRLLVKADEEKLRAKDEELRVNYLNLLLQACKDGAPQMAEVLLQAGTDPNGMHYYKQSTEKSKSLPPPPLIRAVQNKNLGCVKVLLEHGADPAIRANDKTPLEEVCTQS